MNITSFVFSAYVKKVQVILIVHVQLLKYFATFGY